MSGGRSEVGGCGVGVLGQGNVEEGVACFQHWALKYRMIRYSRLRAPPQTKKP